MKYMWAHGIVLIFGMLPTLVSAQGIVPCGDGDGEPDCQTCHIYQLVENIFGWVFGILLIVAAIVIVIGGLRLVFSGGNLEAKRDARKIIRTALISVVLVGTSWTLVDLTIATLSGEAEAGTIWTSLECVAQPTPVVGERREAEEEDEDRSDRVATAWAATGDTIRECARDGARGCEEWVRIPIEERTVTVTRCARTTGTGECNRWVDIDNVEKRYCDPAGDSDPCESYICVQGECAE